MRGAIVSGRSTRVSERSALKCGVLGFSYAGFDHFAQAIADVGHYSCNLGDNAQTIAARHVYRTIGIADDDVVAIDRDTLRSYSGPPTALLMNGVFFEWGLPTPPQITPLFVGFQANEATLRAHRDWLKSHEPIGCRDEATTAHLLALGVDAYTTGCVTMALPPRETAPDPGRLLIVYGGGAGALPPQVLKHVPPDLLDRAEFIHHRQPTNELPLSAASREWIEGLERELLRRYRDEAALVLTPLLHVASPCLGMRMPVILCRNDLDPRFSLLRHILPVHTPDTLDAIDWRPEPIDVSAYVAALTGRVATLIAQARGA